MRAMDPGVRSGSTVAMPTARSDAERWPSQTDVAIIGGGPVGCVTALAHAEQGAEVLLLEARTTVSRRLAGEWLHPTGLAILEKYGAASRERLAGAMRTHGFAVFPEDETRPIILDYPGGQKGLSALHVSIVTALWECVSTHPRITFLQSARAESLDDRKIRVRLRDDSTFHECTAERIVGADGRSSFTRKALGVARRHRLVSYMAAVLVSDVEIPFEGYGHIFLGGLGSVFVYRVDGRTVRICLDVPPEYARRLRDRTFLWEAYKNVLPDALCSSFFEALQCETVWYAANLLSPRCQLGFGSHALVGDAGGCLHPLTAVGMTLGFLDAECLASCRNIEAYQRRRVPESRVPQVLAHGLYQVLSGRNEITVALRRAVYELWRRSPKERQRTMCLLSSGDTGVGSFGAALFKVLGFGAEGLLLDVLGRRAYPRPLSTFVAMTRQINRLGREALSRATGTGSLDKAGKIGEVRGSTGLTQTLDIDASEALHTARSVLLAQQKANGSWEGEVVWCSMLGAQYALTHALLGVPLSAERREGLVLDFRHSQQASGGWGLHSRSEPYLFSTALVYVAARCLGVEHGSTMLRRARAWLNEQGGVAAIPSWGKLWLALFNLYSWDGMRPILPEMWALPRWVPFHPGNLYCHTRLIYAAMSVIFASKYQMPVTPFVEHLRDELYPMPFEQIRFERTAEQVRSAEIVAPPSRLLRMAFPILNSVEKHHSPALREALVGQLVEEVRFDLEQTDFSGLSPVSALLAVIALWLRDPGDQDVHRALKGMDRWLWQDRHGLRVAGAGSVVWDTSLASQALLTAPGSTGETGLSPAGKYLSDQQLGSGHRDLKKHHRMATRGGFCFSARWHGWPVSDCTAEAVLALLGIRDATGRRDTVKYEDAIRFMLSRQNRDGGFGSYERRKTSWPLEWMNATEMFGDAMTEVSYVECTGSCLRALAAFRTHFPDRLVEECDRALDLGTRFLRCRQEPDGAWQGAWGVHCIYGTMFGVVGLTAASDGVSRCAVEKACRWLVERQAADGGWGEHHAGCVQGRFVPAGCSQATQTAWALIALLEAEWLDWNAIERGARFLVAAMQDDGSWPKQDPVGVFFQSALLDYTLYRQIFPVWALGLYERRRLERDSICVKRREHGPRAVRASLRDRRTSA